MIEVKHIWFSYEQWDNFVLKDISFSVEQGDRAALCGPNGCGKSSILKLLCGQDIPYSGTLETASRLVISYDPA